MAKSYLFVPGNRLDQIEKALNSSADVVIIDLEDAVALEGKDRAREKLLVFLTKVPIQNPTKLYVRINDKETTHYKKDLEFVKRFSPIGVMVPKVSSANDLADLESHGVTEQPIIPLIETATGVLNVFEIASCNKRITRLAFGAIDYCLDLSISVTEEGFELIYPRSALVLASRAANLLPPIDTVYLDISNKDGLVKDIKRAKTLGLFSKLCIHPSQLDYVNTLFGASREEVEWAKKVVDAFEKALAQGVSVIQLEEVMIDRPVYKKACQIIKNDSL